MKYQTQFDEMKELVLAAKGPEDVQARVVISLHRNFPQYNWAGIYRLEGQNLLLGPFQGKPTVHTSIPVGKGVCGAAAASRKTEVVPIIKNDAFWGDIDIDSDRPSAFGPDDVEFLEAVARLLPEWL